MLRAACEAFATLEEFNRSSCDCTAAEDADITDALEAASDHLAWETNYRYLGRCDRLIFPCWTGCLAPCMCGCMRGGGIDIPGHDPEVTQVAIDGVPLAEADWEFVADHGNKLFRIDGELWATNSNQSGGPVLAVSVTVGQQLQSYARDAATELACWYLAKDANRERKGLGPGVRSATVDGVQLVIDKEQKAGMRDVARFLTIFDYRYEVLVWTPDDEPAWLS